MKNKVICIVIIISFCFAFSSCAKNSDTDNSKTRNDSSYSQSTDDTNQQSNTSLEYDGKKVKDVVLNLLDSKTSMGTDNVEELLHIEDFCEPVDVKLNMQIGKIVIIYNDDSEYNFGKIYIGNTNNKYYLQIERNGTTNIYELNDDITN
ncbi:MAG: hypothetical protein NC213_10545 [Acetobacter sp.]|nr:hypothetical protein [Bacteroides sp.]MCM1342174.1 hypothetical protein [Acetobacter sp.]MCM1433147.1 hypothetical protein [Clostridiales bacterium]